MSVDNFTISLITKESLKVWVVGHKTNNGMKNTNAEKPFIDAAKQVKPEPMMIVKCR
jgi:hypothetical protein